MNLTRYVAKWGWASLFILTWLKVMAWWVGPPELLLAAFLLFGGVTGASTGLYIYGLYRFRHYERQGEL